MILDPKGNEIPAPAPKHRFGTFIIPDDVRVKGFRDVASDNPADSCASVKIRLPTLATTNPK